MKRPFLLIGGACIAASFLLPLFGALFSAAVLLAAGVSALCLMPKDKRLLPRSVITLFILLIIGIRFASLDLYISYKNDRLVPLEADIEAIVTEVSLQDGISRFSLDITSSTEDEAKGISVAGYTFDPVDFSPGDKIAAKVVFKDNDDRYKAANFDSGKYFTVKLNDCYILQRSASPIYSFADKARKYILNTVNSLGADSEADLLGAVMIGDRHSIAIDVDNDVKATGTGHMLVVSGLHLGIMCGLLMRLLRSRLSRRLTVTVMVLFVILVAIICLFHISILRAGIAYIIMLTGMFFFKDSDPLNSLGMATTLLAFFFPYIFYNVAFMLSVSATFAVIGPANTLINTFRFNRKKRPSLLKKAAQYVFETAVVAVCALIFTLPITVYYFGSSSLIAPLSNLFLSFSVTGMLAFGIFGVLFRLIPVAGKIISLPFIYIAKLFAKYFLFTVKLLAESGVGFVDLSPDKSIYCGIFALIFLFTVHIVCKKINSKKEIRPFAYRKDPEISP